MPPATPLLSAVPFVSNGLMTYDFQGIDGATSTLQTSGSLTTTTTLNNSTISNVHGPAAGFTSLYINGSSSATTARSEVTSLNIGPTSFTWEGWIYYPSFSTSVSLPTVFSIGNNSTNLLAVRWVANNTAEMRTNINNSSVGQGGNVAMSASPSSGVWQHHAITADSTNYRYYLDGVLRGQTTNNNGTWGYQESLGRAINVYTIGNWLGGPYSNPWSNAYYWNCRLSNSVVYSANFTVTKTGMF